MILFYCSHMSEIICNYLFLPTTETQIFFLALQNVPKDRHTVYRMTLNVNIRYEYTFSKTEPQD